MMLTRTTLLTLAMVAAMSTSYVSAADRKIRGGGDLRAAAAANNDLKDILDEQANDDRRKLQKDDKEDKDMMEPYGSK